MKETKGITLIALVITVIVLVILAGVAINTVIGNDSVIKNAENAVGKYNNGIKEEQKAIDNIINYMEQSTEGGSSTPTTPSDPVNPPKEDTTTVTATTVASDASYIGKYVNYTVPSGGDPDVKWRIFYADNDNIYLIASDYLKYDYVPTKGSTTMHKNSDYKLSFDDMYKAYTGSANITDSRITKWIKWVGQYPSSTNANIRSIAYMLDMGIWNTMYANNYAEYAIGGPTIEMFCASYKATHSSRYIECESEGWNESGYQVKWSDGSYSAYISELSTSELENLYVISDTSKTYAYWLASPSAYSGNGLLYVNYNGRVGYDYYNYSGTGLRALVCLKSNVQLVPTENENTYNLN